MSEDRKKPISYTPALTIDSRRSRKREVKLLQALSVGLEPFLYGQSAGVSTVALLVAVAFWT